MNQSETTKEISSRHPVVMAQKSLSTMVIHSLTIMLSEVIGIVSQVTPTLSHNRTHLHLVRGGTSTTTRFLV